MNDERGQDIFDGVRKYLPPTHINRFPNWSLVHEDLAFFIFDTSTLLTSVSEITWDPVRANPHIPKSDKVRRDAQIKDEMHNPGVLKALFEPIIDRGVILITEDVLKEITQILRNLMGHTEIDRFKSVWRRCILVPGNVTTFNPPQPGTKRGIPSMKSAKVLCTNDSNTDDDTGFVICTEAQPSSDKISPLSELLNNFSYLLEEAKAAVGTDREVVLESGPPDIGSSSEATTYIGNYDSRSLDIVIKINASLGCCVGSNLDLDYVASAHTVNLLEEVDSVREMLTYSLQGEDYFDDKIEKLTAQKKLDKDSVDGRELKDTKRWRARCRRLKDWCRYRLKLTNGDILDGVKETKQLRQRHISMLHYSTTLHIPLLTADYGFYRSLSAQVSEITNTPYIAVHAPRSTVGI